LGYLEGGFDTWLNLGFEVDRIPSVNVREFELILKKGKVNILDVRKKSEFDSEHIIGAINTPLDYIEDSSKKIDKTETYYIHCAGGYRSMIFASILKSKGYDNLIDVEGGFTAMKEAGRFEFSEYVCPTTML
jgi:hydroxyacylglutathione hydrolase